MARIRTIKPEFWASEDVAAVCRDARLLFIGLLNFADDSGNGPASPKGLRMKVFPGDSDVTPAKIEKWLDELDKELIGLYEAGGKQYYHVMKWEHQRIDKPQKAKYPLFTDRSRNDTRTLPPDSIGRDRIVREGIVKDRIVKDSTVHEQKLKWFNIFWTEEIWKDLSGKTKAREAWLKIPNLDQQLFEEICKGAIQYQTTRQNILDNKGRIKMAQGWLNDRRWEDAPPLKGIQDLTIKERIGKMD